MGRLFGWVNGEAWRAGDIKKYYVSFKRLYFWGFVISF
jgi:hypothetical protein